MRFLSLCLILCAFSVHLQAQIGIAPPVVFMNANNRFGSMTVENGTDQTQEVTIKFKFGYPTSDSVGILSMRFDDTVFAQSNSCGDWLKVFPRKFTLGARQRQTVRFFIQPPAGIAEKTYWTRCITTAQPQKDFINTVRSGVTTRISFSFEQITTVVYTVGNPVPVIEIQGKGIVCDSSSAHVLWNVRQSGTSPFFGTAVTTLSDAGGNIVATTTETLAIYASMMKRSTFEKRNLLPGNYQADVVLTARRNDIPPEVIPKCPEARTQFKVLLP
jgi:hypothetical protein